MDPPKEVVNGDPPLVRGDLVWGEFSNFKNAYYLAIILDDNIDGEIDKCSMLWLDKRVVKNQISQKRSKENLIKFTADYHKDNKLTGRIAEGANFINEALFWIKNETANMTRLKCYNSFYELKLPYLRAMSTQEEFVYGAFKLSRDLNDPNVPTSPISLAEFQVVRLLRDIGKMHEEKAIALEQERKELGVEVVKLEAEIGDPKKIQLEKDLQLQDIKDENLKLKREMKQLQDTHAQTVKELKKKLAEKTREMEESQKEKDDVIKDVEAKLEASSRECEQNKLKAEKLQTELNVWKLKVAPIEKDLKESLAREKELKEMQKADGDKIIQLDREVRRLQIQFDEESSKADFVRERFDALSVDNEALLESIITLKKQNLDYEKKLMRKDSKKHLNVSGIRARSATPSMDVRRGGT